MKADEILNRVRFDFPENGKIVAGLSGGADSVLLTHLLYLRFGSERLRAVHVHHGIRGAEADRDAAFSESFCLARNIRFTLCRFDVPRLAKEAGEGLEACARRVRYDCFSKAADGLADVIVTAHTADDNAETVLMNLTRGSGIAGASGIPEHRGKIFRPLLHITRSEVEFLCEHFGLSFVTDSTNLDPAYTRNRFRLEILPALKTINPRAVEAITRYSDLMAAAYDFLSSSADALLRSARTRWGWSLPVLCEAHSAVLREALRKLAAPYKPLGYGETEEAEKCVRTESCATFSDRVRFEAKRGTLTVTPCVLRPVYVPLLEGKTVLEDGREVVFRRERSFFFKKKQNVHSLFFDNALDCDTISCVPVLRTRKEGDRFSPAGRGLRKPLRRLMSELGIPAAVRDRLLLLEADGEIVWVEGIGAAEGFAVTERTEWVFTVEILSENEGNEV